MTPTAKAVVLDSIDSALSERTLFRRLRRGFRSPMEHSIARDTDALLDKRLEVMAR